MTPGFAFVRLERVMLALAFTSCTILFAACGGADKHELARGLAGGVPAAGGPGDAKRGVAFHFCGWKTSRGEADLRAMLPGLSWYYNWSSRPLTCPDGSGVGDSSVLTKEVVEFVPMAWGLVDDGRGCDSGGPCFRVDERSGGEICGDACKAQDWSFDPEGECYRCYHEGVSREAFLDDVPMGAKHLLGYNEPNFKQQANLTPAVAAANWRHLEWVADQRGLALVGPATNFCDPTPGANHPGACIDSVNGDAMIGLAWLERFYDACAGVGPAGRACRIDYQAVHAYSCGGVMWMIRFMKGKAGLIDPDVEHCGNGVRDEDEFGVDCGGNFCAACSAQAREYFSKPLWLTEFANPKHDCGGDGVDLERRTLELIAFELPRLDRDPYVFRYAWFMPKVSIESLDHADLLVEDRAGVLNTQGRVYFGRMKSPDE